MTGGFLGTISADLTLNNKMGSTIASASASMKSMETQMKKVGTSLATSLDGPMAKLKAMPAETKYLGAALSLGVTAPLLAFGTTATKTFASFDDAMRQVQAVTGATGPQFQALTALAREMGETTSFKASEAAEAMNYLGMAGFKTEDIIGALPATLALARAGVLDLGSAADIMSNVMTIFGMEAEEAGHAADVLAKVAHSTNTNVQQLGEAMTYAGPVAHTFGLSMEMTAAAMGLLGNAGIQASMAGTTLRGILQELVAPTKASMDVFTKYGLTLEDLNPKVHSLDVIFKTLKESGMSDAEMFTVFGQRAGPGLQALLSQGIDKLGEYSIELQNVDGYAQHASDTMDAGFGGALRMMSSALEAFSLSMGNRLSIMLEPIVIWIKKAATAFSDLNPHIQDAIIIIGLLLAAIGPVILGLAVLPTIVAGVSGGLVMLSGAFGAVVAILSGGIVPVILAVVAALYILEEKTGLVSGAWQFAKDAFVIFADVISKAIVKLKEIIVENTEWIREAVSDIIPTEAIEKVTEWYNTIKSAFGEAGEIVHERADGIREENKKTSESFDLYSDVDMSGTKDEITSVEKLLGSLSPEVTENTELLTDMGDVPMSGTISEIESVDSAMQNAGSTGKELKYIISDAGNVRMDGTNSQISLVDENGKTTALTIKELESYLEQSGNVSQGGTIGQLALVDSTGKVVNLTTEQMISLLQNAGNQPMSATIAGWNGITNAEIAATSQAYKFIDAATLANTRIGAALKTTQEMAGNIAALAGKWNLTADLGVTSSGGKGTGEGNVKVVSSVTQASQKTASETATRAANTTVYNNNVKINTVNNNGSNTSNTKTKAVV